MAPHLLVGRATGEELRIRGERHRVDTVLHTVVQGVRKARRRPAGERPATRRRTQGSQEEFRDATQRNRPTTRLQNSWREARRHFSELTPKWLRLEPKLLQKTPQQN